MNIHEENTNLAGTKQIIYRFRTPQSIDVIDENGHQYPNTTLNRFRNGTLMTPEEKKIAGRQGIRPANTESKQYGKDINENLDMTKDEIIAYHQKETLNDVIRQLVLHHKCAVIRPCGFGKSSEIFIKLAIAFSDKNVKCLYVSPNKKNSEETLSRKLNSVACKDVKVDFRSYTWLGSIAKDDEALRNLDYGFIYYDEMDDLGSPLRSLAAKKIEKWHPETAIVGATATPERMDGVDVLGYLFDNITAYPYGVNEALEDEIIKFPYYLCTYYNVEQYIKDLDKTISKKELTEEQLMEIISKDQIRKLHIHELPQNIKKAFAATKTDTNYMKFLVFCTSVEKSTKKRSCEAGGSIEEMVETVPSIINKAFPDHEIQIHNIHSKANIQSIEGKSEDEMTVKDEIILHREQDAVASLPVIDNHIDIIFACEKMTRGYHDNKLSAIMMYRSTYSHSKYIQMLGRSFDLRNDKPMIIFDIVDNLSRKPKFKRVNDPEEKIEEVEAPKWPSYEEVRKMARSNKKHTKKSTNKPCKPSKETAKEDDTNKDIDNDSPISNTTKVDLPSAIDDIKKHAELREELLKDNDGEEVTRLEEGKRAGKVTFTQITKENKDGTKTSILVNDKELETAKENIETTDEKDSKENENEIEIDKDDTFTQAPTTEKGSVTPTPKPTPKPPRSPRPKTKQAETSYIFTDVEEDSYEGQTFIESALYNQSGNGISLYDRIINERKAETRELIERMENIQTEATIKAAVKEYLDVEGCDVVKDLEDLSDGTEKDKHQIAILKFCADKYHINISSIVYYMATGKIA